VAPPSGHDGEVRTLRPHARRLLPAGPDVRGKSSDDSDVVEARYVDIVPDDRVVQAVDFDSDDPAFAGTMTMTWSVQAVDRGTRVQITAEDVPDGISADDHAAGLTSSLENLARYVESGPPGPSLPDGPGDV
jgi:uncharacterized protein YndB with AHSA1/START domain